MLDLRDFERVEVCSLCWRGYNSLGEAQDSTDQTEDALLESMNFAPPCQISAVKQINPQQKSKIIKKDLRFGRPRLDRRHFSEVKLRKPTPLRK